MAVVTHGSFDEGPVVLALPSVYEYAGAEETDPIFTAWDKHTGIVITHDHITDFDNAVAAIANVATPDGYATDQEVTDLFDTFNGELIGYLEGAYVPYTGASGNVDVGVNTISAGRMYVDNETPIASTELATKGYVDYIGSGGTVSEGIAHNDTTDKEGGGGGHWYHLSATQAPIVVSITDETTIGDPTGLYVIGTGISVVAGHESAYIDLGWDANAESNLGWYVVYYKQSSLLLWSELIVYTNTVHIEGLLPSTSYDFGVAAANKMGQVTSMCLLEDITMPGDDEAPATVQGVAALGLIQAVLLTWTHNTDVDLAGYHIYRNTEDDSGTAVDIAVYSGNKFVDNGLVKDTEYFYWIKAVDRSGNQSVAFSTVVSATTRNVIASDIENIAANQVIIQGTTTFASWITPATTTIDGDKITTGSITLAQLNFTPIEGGTIVATLNASAEGLQIDADLFSVSGATIFTPKTIIGSSTLSRVSFYPNSTTGMKVTDDLGQQVFLIEIGGTNVGDVTIGKYTAGQGIWYDKSANITHFAGRIEATSGSISGVFDFGTQAVSYTGQDENIALIGADIYENTANAHGSAIRINRIGYNGGTTRYRNTIIYDGEANQVLIVNGAGRSVTVYGELNLSTTTGALVVPSMTTTQRVALSKAAGSIVYDTTQRRFCGVIMNNLGILEWWTFGMNTNLG